MDEISDIAKISIVLGILTSCVLVTLTIVLISNKFFNNVVFDTSIRVKSDSSYHIDEISSYSNPLPVPAIYYTLYDFGFKNLAQFDLDINGTRYNDPSELVRHFDKKMYIRSVELPDGLHIWVGDYKR